MKNMLINRLKAFRDDTRGVVAVEVAVMFPILFWALLSSFVFFDAYRQSSINQKAAYTLSDMLSRETEVNNDFIDGLYGVFGTLTRSWTERKMRVTVIRWDNNNNIFKRDWSVTRGSVTPLSNTSVRNWTHRLPQMPHNERIILVETWSRYTPPFNVGINDQDLQTFVFTRPRFSPTVSWES